MITLSLFGLSPEQRRERVRQIGHVVLAEWSAEARGVLRSTLVPYLAALQISEITDNSVTVSLPGPGVSGQVAQLARIVEFGMGPGGIGTQGSYDVRKFLLGATARWKWGRNGPYVNVPFSWRLMDIGLAASGKGAQAAVSAASKLTGTATDPMGKITRWGGRLGAGMAAKMAAHHVSDPLAGLVRKVASFSQGPGKKAVTQTTGFMTWRTASWRNTDPKAWRSRGVEAKHIAQTVTRKLPDLIRQVFSK